MNIGVGSCGSLRAFAGASPDATGDTHATEPYGMPSIQGEYADGGSPSRAGHVHFCFVVGCTDNFGDMSGSASCLIQHIFPEATFLEE